MKTKITIKRRTLPQWMVWLLIIMPFTLSALNELAGLPYAIRYVMDAAWVVLMCVMAVYWRRFGSKKMRNCSVWISVFFIFVLLVYLVQFQSVWYFLWGARNVFRFYVAFLAFVVFLSEKDVDRYVELFDTLFWVDILVCLYQYFSLDIMHDQMGGLFGFQGGNSFTNIYFLIVLAKSMIFYLEKKERLESCIAKSIAALAVAAMSELKFFFVEYVILIMLSALFTGVTLRKILTVFGGILAVVAGAGLLTLIFPFWGEWFSVSWFLETATSNVGYTGSGDLNRLTAISRINELWLTHWSQRIFGMGLGNCDTSSFAIVNTPFFEQWGHMHYTWMSYAIMYLECGWVGLIFYFGFFVLVYLQIQKIEKRSEGVARSYCRVSKIMAILCPLIAVYNSSLRAESAYMAYFVLAIPFVYARSGQTKGTQMKKRENEVPLKG